MKVKSDLESKNRKETEKEKTQKQKKEVNVFSIKNKDLNDKGRIKRPADCSAGLKY